MKNRNLKGKELVKYYECLFRVREHETLSFMFKHENQYEGGDFETVLESAIVADDRAVFVELPEDAEYEE